MWAFIPFVVKTLGAFLVLCSGAGLGFKFAGSLENELREIGCLEAGLMALLSHVTYALDPLPHALVAAGRAAGGATGALLARMGAATGMFQRRTPEDALEFALQEGEPVPPEVVGVLRDLSRNLGTSGHKEQARFIEMSMERAKALRMEFADECTRKARLYRYLGIAGGASLAIILL